ncbi:hypothetical protein V6N13_049416 [Hibiscus sabdariffa]
MDWEWNQLPFMAGWNWNWKIYSYIPISHPAREEEEAEKEGGHAYQPFFIEIVRRDSFSNVIKGQIAVAMNI